MGKFSGWLVASDYDGTLVPDYEKRVSDGVRAALTGYIAEGGLFTVCTGRTYLGFHSYSPDIINAPGLLANGGMAYDYARGEVFFVDGLGSESFAAVRDIRDNFPDVSIEMYALRDTCAINLNDRGSRHFTSQDIPFRVIDDPCQSTTPWAKAMFGSTPETNARVQAFLREKHPEISFLPTDGSYLEVLSPGVDKGTALLKLARLLGIDASHTCAVGDGYNDEAMLRAAAYAFVPENGDPRMKAIATHVVRSNNDGAIANVIELLGGIVG